MHLPGYQLSGFVRPPDLLIDYTMAIRLYLAVLRRKACCWVAISMISTSIPSVLQANWMLIAASHPPKHDTSVYS